MFFDFTKTATKAPRLSVQNGPKFDYFNIAEYSNHAQTCSTKSAVSNLDIFVVAN